MLSSQCLDRWQAAFCTATAWGRLKDNGQQNLMVTCGVIWRPQWSQTHTHTNNHQPQGQRPYFSESRAVHLRLWHCLSSDYCCLISAYVPSTPFPHTPSTTCLHLIMAVKIRKICAYAASLDASFCIYSDILCLNVSSSSDTELNPWTDCLDMMMETAKKLETASSFFTLLVPKIVSVPLPISDSKWSLNCSNDCPVGQLEFDPLWSNVCRCSVSQTKAR